MRTAGVTKAMWGGVLFFGVSWGTMAGCSTDDASTAGKPVPAGYCPNTVRAAAGVACTQDGLICPIGYQCGSVPEQANCVCTAGLFVCTDAAGETVAKGAEPTCVPQGQGNDQECPATEDVAHGKPCTTAGLLCYYSGLLCPEGNGVPNRDVCQCKGSPLQLECEIESCHPKSDASDDAYVVPPVDSGNPADGSAG